MIRGTHAKAFTGAVVEPITDNPLTRSQARAVEQAYINRHGMQKNGGKLQNKRNSIADHHSWYSDAVDWGTTWLEEVGIL